MLRNRSRRGAVGAKQGLMSESSTATLQSPKHKPSCMFPSPRPFMAFSPSGFLDCEASSMSPTSILDTKHLSSSVLNPFLSERSLKKAPLEPTGPKPVGLGLVDVLGDDEGMQKPTKVESRKVVLGSKLRIQIPSVRAGESVSSPIEFGVKNRDAQLALLSPAQRLLPEAAVGSPSARVFAGGIISPREMAMSEDYTCVISRGPNPRTTHIFDDCIVESCGDAFVERKEKGLAADCGALPAHDFLSSCHACKKNLGQGNDIFIYRGEKAFCSSECRYQEMIFDEAVDILR